MDTYPPNVDCEENSPVTSNKYISLYHVKIEVSIRYPESSDLSPQHSIFIDNTFRMFGHGFIGSDTLRVWWKVSLWRAYRGEENTAT